uniref:Putative secreted protein n=1 Tax=Anopheles marajoara TaxID=58244 RepID=A0A2M4CDK2_9DIPT
MRTSSSRRTVQSATWTICSGCLPMSVAGRVVPAAALVQHHPKAIPYGGAIVWNRHVYCAGCFPVQLGCQRRASV